MSNCSPLPRREPQRTGPDVENNDVSELPVSLPALPPADTLARPSMELLQRVRDGLQVLDSTPGSAEPAPDQQQGNIQCCLPGTSASVAHARAWLTTWLDALNTPADMAADATLVLSELASNASTHTRSCGPRSSYHISLHHGPNTLLVTVSDAGGPSEPRPRTADDLPDPLAESGRGLILVSLHSARWWVTGDQNGRTITAELSQNSPGTRAATPTTKLGGSQPQ